MYIPQEENYYETLDRSLQVAISRVSHGISPAALMIAFFDWYIHLAIHPAKQMKLIELFQENYWHLVRQYFGHIIGDPRGEYCALTSPQDKRFVDKRWQEFPYNYIYESFLMTQQWWHHAATGARGVNRHHEEVVDFTLLQILDMLFPSNSPLTNPEIQDITFQQQSENFVRGYNNFIEDISRIHANKPPIGAENFIIGKNIAVTPGKVIYRNRLIELIQYSPLTKKVHPEPILITSAWIMKYYLDFGIKSALNVISSVIPHRKIHLLGYCLGGTLAAIAAASMAQDNDNRLASLTLLAAQTDFTEPGELGLFIDESQIVFLENMMKEKGYLDTNQMAGAFQLLRSNDLIWSRLIHDYLLGKRKPLTDLMAWNADATRLPYQMHSEYLRNLFLHNQLAEGKYCVKGKPISLTDITIPVFVVATERDHVSPWHSVFKINLLTSSDVTFALTSGGHNVGIVSMPVKKTKRYYRVSTLKESDRFIDADSWYKTTKPSGGSWWPTWETWLTKHSGKMIKSPPPMGCKKKGYLPLEDAPGTYVLQK